MDYFQTRTLEDGYKFVGFRSLIQGCSFPTVTISAFQLYKNLAHRQSIPDPWLTSRRHVEVEVTARVAKSQYLALRSYLKTTSLHTTKVSPQRSNINDPVPHSDTEIRSTRKLKFSVLH